MRIGMYASFSEGFITCNPVRLHSGEDSRFTVVQKADTGGGWRVVYCVRGMDDTNVGSVQLSSVSHMLTTTFRF
jgi:hypothetical protein